MRSSVGGCLHTYVCTCVPARDCVCVCTCVCLCLSLCAVVVVDGSGGVLVFSLKLLRRLARIELLYMITYTYKHLYRSKDQQFIQQKQYLWLEFLTDECDK